MTSRQRAAPPATEACRKTSYLVTDDLVLVGERRDEFTCISYQSPQVTNLDERLAAERGACACRASAEVAGIGLDRRVGPARPDHDQERRWRQVAH